ncbi:hypothetical protein PsYK624_096690 [Phanerochaete sordida]|uniref:Uncharacterized protein n=1 Tax=Phanerochaete sordida TaxID=48140 RepID=A0A9P3GGY7_9APHY|nr:hypothetical protein PsYK624_096690 [Phanerochaete sordida]
MSTTIVGTAQKSDSLTFYAAFMLNKDTLRVYVGNSDTALPDFRVSDAKLTYTSESDLMGNFDHDIKVGNDLVIEISSGATIRGKLTGFGAASMSGTGHWIDVPLDPKSPD